jgi:hypothetical protein
LSNIGLVIRSEDVAMKKAISIALLCGLLVVSSVAAQSAPEEIEVGALIERVISGEDFSGKEIILKGVALNQTTTGDHLVNIGTRETYQSGAHLNFVSVYDTSVTIKKGTYATVKVLVETSSAYNLGGQWTIVIETAYLECIAC